MSFKRFESKILLFGEYGALYKGKALTIPYKLFFGKLAFPTSERERQSGQSSHGEIRKFAGYLIESCGDILDLAPLKRDIERGLYFKSTIPRGFGLGSSGAVCAAIFDRYRKVKEKISPSALRDIFIRMESHFHGISSGVDPLISYLGKPLLFDSDNAMSEVDLNFSSEGRGALFLFNTGQTRQTIPLVNLFLEKCKSAFFETFLLEKIMPATNRCIKFFLEGDEKRFWESFVQLSAYQFDSFRPMIPKRVRHLWEKGLGEGQFALKLCGAGGGGVFLGVTKDFGQLQHSLGEDNISPVCFFS